MGAKISRVSADTKHRIFLALVCCTVLTATMILPGTTSAHDNLLVNGSFDLQVPSNGSDNWWTSANIDGAGGWRSVDENGFFILNDNGNQTTDPMIEQRVTGLKAGLEYLIEGEYCNYYVGFCNNSALSFAIDVDDNTILELKNTGVCYEPFETRFFAEATEQTIRFRAEANGSDCDYAIDNLRVALLDIIFKDSFE